MPSAKNRKNPLQPGDDAPLFSLATHEQKTFDLSERKKEGWTVLYFYPKDMTPGCTTEACNFRDDFPEFNKLDAVILGVSKDSVQKHLKFAQKYDLPFSLISDENGAICETYGVWQEKSMYGKKYMGIVRSTFIIDPQGKIAKIYPKVRVKTHADEVFEDLKKLM